MAICGSGAAGSCALWRVCCCVAAAASFACCADFHLPAAGSGHVWHLLKRGHHMRALSMILPSPSPVNVNR
ncbi:hypothetical protein V8E36_008896 [Tilletia maclaganii]